MRVCLIPTADVYTTAQLDSAVFGADKIHPRTHFGTGQRILRAIELSERDLDGKHLRDTTLQALAALAGGIAFLLGAKRGSCPWPCSLFGSRCVDRSIFSVITREQQNASVNKQTSTLKLPRCLPVCFRMGRQRELPLVATSCQFGEIRAGVHGI